jgi:PHD/YefM family antitoxin component YafN of YafNO toxin-antitoxin module
MTITPELRQTVDAAGGEPVCLKDPETRHAYVLLKAEDYERIREVLDDERLQEAFREAGLRSAIRGMKDNGD